MTEEELKDPLLDLDNLDNDEIKESPEAVEADLDNTHQETNDQEEEEKDVPEKEQPKKELTAKEKRHQEQEAGSAVEAIRLRNLLIDREVKDASKDIMSLIELQKEDPKLAKEVAAKFDWADTTRGDYDSFLTSKWVKADKPVYISDEEIDKRVEAKLAQREHDAALVEAIDLINKLPQELQAEAVEEFNDLTDGKMLTRAKALKIANMVTLSLKKGAKSDTSEALKKLSTTQISTSKKPAESEMVEVLVDGKIVLLDSKQLK